MARFSILPTLRKVPAWWAQRQFAGAGATVGAAPSWPPVLLALLAGLFFYGRLGCPLLEPEEARYAEIPRQMLVQGRGLTPVLHGEHYLQKPPLFYWLVMLCYQVFGVHDWVARLVPATAGVALVLVVHGWARRTLGWRAALAGGIMLCLSPRFPYQAGMVSMDGLLCLWVIVGLAAGHLALREQDVGQVADLPISPGNEERQVSDLPHKCVGLLSWGRHSCLPKLKADRNVCPTPELVPTPPGPPFVRGGLWFASALCCGLGILTKGPVAAVLIVVPLVAWLVVERRRAAVSWRAWLVYGAVVLAVAAPWYFAVSLRDPGAAGNFFWLHNLVRYLAPFDHEKPAWYYLPGLALGLFPWSLLLVPLVPYLARRAPRWARRRPAALGFFVLALAWCLAFFSLSGCKRPGYILPAFPLLAMMLGTCLTRLYPRRWVRPAWICAAGALAMALLAVNHWFLPDYHRQFGLRGQVRRHVELAQSLPVVCCPKRWDSVSFYLEKEVACAKLDGMGALPAEGALLFVKKAVLPDVLAAGVDFEPCGRQGTNVLVGIARRRK